MDKYVFWLLKRVNVSITGSRKWFQLQCFLLFKIEENKKESEDIVVLLKMSKNRISKINFKTSSIYFADSVFFFPFAVFSKLLFQTNVQGSSRDQENILFFFFLTVSLREKKNYIIGNDFQKRVLIAVSYIWHFPMFY